MADEPRPEPQEPAAEPKKTSPRIIIGAWALFVLAIVVAFGRAATAKPRTEPDPANEAARRVAYSLMAAEERNMRRDAVKDFPADPWSQDDAFHNSEYKRARNIAKTRNMALGDVLRSADEGMREHWSKPVGIYQKPTVPPCRPRPIH